MKKVKSKISTKTHKGMAEFIRIGRNAVIKARAENFRFGLPNVSGRDGKLIYEMPNGEIIIKDISPKKGF